MQTQAYAIVELGYSKPKNEELFIPISQCIRSHHFLVFRKERSNEISKLEFFKTMIITPFNQAYYSTNTYK